MGQILEMLFCVILICEGSTGDEVLKPLKTVEVGWHKVW